MGSRGALCAAGAGLVGMEGLGEGPAEKPPNDGAAGSGFLGA
jgi:hypothetical protein